MIIATSTLTSKGQATIPKVFRDRLGLKPNDVVRFEMIDDATMVVRRPLTADELRAKVGAPTRKQPLTESEKAQLQARGLA